MHKVVQYLDPLILKLLEEVSFTEVRHIVSVLLTTYVGLLQHIPQVSHIPLEVCLRVAAAKVGHP